MMCPLIAFKLAFLSESLYFLHFLTLMFFFWKRIGEVHWLDLGIEAISFKVEIPASIEENKDNDNQIEAIDFCIAYGMSCRRILMIFSFMHHAFLFQITYAILYRSHYVPILPEQMKDVSFMKRGMSVRFNYVCGENFSPYHAAILKVPKGIHPRLRIFIRGNPSVRLRGCHSLLLRY